MLASAYKMVERGRLSIREALADFELKQSEEDFAEGMLAAGYKLPDEELSCTE